MIMLRYFFDFHDGVEIIDEDGEDCPDIGGARARAVRLASGFSATPKVLGESGGAVVVTVRGGQSNVLLTVRLVLTIEEG